MAVPKRRQSKGRSASRRAQWMKIAIPASNPCPQCGEPRLSHRACPSCGQYGSKDAGRSVISTEAKTSQAA